MNIWTYFQNCRCSFREKKGNKSQDLTYCSLLQLMVYNFNKIESTLPASSRFRDGRRNLFVNTSKRSCLFCFPNNVAKTWSLRWKFQGTLKSSISFSWKSVFICLMHSMEVMSQIQKVRYVLNIFVPFTYLSLLIIKCFKS